MTTVDIHVGRRTALDKDDHPTLALALAERGVAVTFSRATEAYDLQAGRVGVLHPRFHRRGVGDYDLEVTPGTVALEDIDAIRNIAVPLGGGLPELNAPEVRSLTEDKLAANRLLAGLGLAKSFALLDHMSGIDEVLDVVSGKMVVVKPRHGARSINVWIGSKSRLAALHRAGRINLGAGWIVEELLDTTVPFPIRSRDADQQEQIDQANNGGVPKELRVFAFGRDSSGRLITSAVIRLGQAGDRYLNHVHEDEWVTVDPRWIPQEVAAETGRIVSAVEMVTSAREIHLAVDWVPATADVGERSWIPIEINDMPELMFELDDLAAAYDHTNKLADQLLRVAEQRHLRGDE